MHRVVVDSDDEDAELSLENDDQPGSRVSDLDAPSISAPSHEEDNDEPGTGSTDKLLKEAHALILDGTSPSEGNANKRKRTTDDCDGRTNSTKKARQQGSDVWDVPSSASPQRPTTEPPRQQPAVTLTSSEVRRRYQPTPTEVATSSTSRPPFELSTDNGDSGVSMDGIGRADAADAADRAPIETRIMIVPPRSKRSRNNNQSSQEHSSPVSKRKRAGRKSAIDVAEDLDEQDDELAFEGLPRETYKVRPSRSRATSSKDRTTTEYPADPLEATDELSSSRIIFSKASPIRKSQGSKRSRHSTNDVGDFDEMVAQIIEMGFTPSQAQLSLAQSDYDVTRATEMLLEGTIEPGQAVKPPEPLKMAALEQAGLKDEQHDQKTDNASARGEQSEIVSMPSAATSPQKTPKSKKTTAKKRGRPKKEQKKSQETPKAEIAAARNESPASTLAVPEEKTPSRPAKGKGRGRPKKESILKSEEVSRDEEEDLDIKMSISVPGAVHVSAANQATVPGPGELERQASATKVHEDEEHVESEEKENIDPRPDALKAVESSKTAQNQKPDAKPSPAQCTNGRVPYRIGLSKRMKIPSLLRSAQR